MKEIEGDVVQKNFLWFEAFHPDHPEVINENYDPDNPTLLFKIFFGSRLFIRIIPKLSMKTMILTIQLYFS